MFLERAFFVKTPRRVLAFTIAKAVDSAHLPYLAVTESRKENSAFPFAPNELYLVARLFVIVSRSAEHAASRTVLAPVVEYQLVWRLDRYK